MLDAETLAHLPDDPFPQERLTGYSQQAVPVFFGHYWLSGPPPATQSPNAACLDYSVGKPGGALCCYRLDDEKALEGGKFVRVGRRGVKIEAYKANSLGTTLLIKAPALGANADAPGRSSHRIHTRICRLTQRVPFREVVHDRHRSTKNLINMAYLIAGKLDFRLPP